MQMDDAASSGQTQAQRASSAKGKKAKYQQKRQQQQQQKAVTINGEGTLEKRVGLLERMLLLAMSLLMKHDYAIRQWQRETCMALGFLEENMITACLRAAKQEWDELRVPGKPHPAGRGFREVGWELLWRLAKSAVEAAKASGGIMGQDADALEQSVKLLGGALPAVDRFYPIILEARPKSEQNKENENPDAAGDNNSKNVQIWVVKFKGDQMGQQAHAALQQLQEEGSLGMMMEAEYRADRAPMQSMAKVLSETLRRSSPPKEEK